VSKASNTQGNQSPASGHLGGLDFWKFIDNKLSANINVMLLYVLASDGSSPGRKGFKMAVAADDELCGTIGGGIMEFKLVEKARSLLDSGVKEINLIEQFHDKTHDKNQSGMICSGSQINVLIPLNPSSSKTTITKIMEAQKQNENKTIHLSPAGIKITDEIAEGFNYTTETDWNYTEALNQKPVLHIIGGGHVGLALSELMHFLGFYIKLYDDRNELNTIEQNLFADEKYFIDYNTIGDNMTINENDFIVIMTIGYRTDKLVLQQLLNQDCLYLGLLGSEKKNEKLFFELKAEGAASDKLDKVFGPVGLNIFSKTTREIAISIAAQIILIKNKDLPTGRTGMVNGE
jgi:xanthine dehydrogenase accessory factor